MSNFPPEGKQAVLNMLAARPLKAALYSSLGKKRFHAKAYTPKNEIADGLGYSAGGVPLTGAITGIDGETAWLTFNDPQWPSAAFADVTQMQIYDSETNTVFMNLDFAQPLNGQGATFRVELPPANASEAIIRL